MQVHPPTSKRVAIVGAGVGGLSCARTLSAAGYAVTVFEQAAVVGGRCSTRVEPSLSFDHGAQYFTVRDPELAALVEGWCTQGSVAPWQPRLWTIDGRVGPRSGAGPVEAGPTRYVAVPGMGHLAALLLAEIDPARLQLHLETRITAVHREKFDWTLVDEAGRAHERFAFVVLNLPAEQAAPMLAGHAEALRARALACAAEPCWTAMITLARPLALDFDAAFVDGSPLAWIANNASKPGRPPTPCWVLQASGDWSRAHLERDPDFVARELIACFAALIDRRLEPRFVAAHRWHHAKPTPLPEPCLIDRIGIGACGDWCGGPRIEGAFVSGRSLAEAVTARAAGLS